ncbi:MAG TPA: FadR/GntR family transcriptional regulator [Chloroflexota bacterium]|jgi:GntR family transcriptional repressor for pyruvate dehydrogenase complex
MSLGEPLTREPGLADRVAQHMTDRVLDGTLARGMRLPPERALAEEYGVSRTVIREAVRTLASRGLLETHGGSGIYVRRPDPMSAGASISLLMRLHHGDGAIRYEKVHEVRRVLEVEIATLAAKRAQPTDIEAMERQIERQRRGMSDREVYVTSDVAFHAALATATHNELFSALLDSIADIMTEVRQLGFNVPSAQESALAHHLRILENVKTGDAVGAARAMKDHLRDSQRILRQGLEIAAVGQGEAIA